MIRLAHIINPTAAKPPSDLVVAQPIAAESLRIARHMAGQWGIQVSLMAVHAPGEERIHQLDGFQVLPDLARTVLDLQSFQLRRPLPLLRDILDRLFAFASDSDYLIYSNADICIQPYFYLSVIRMLEHGHDALVINRRTLPANWSTPSELPTLWAQVGNLHIGHDCFVFRRDAYPAYELADVCIGVRLVGRVLIWNLLAHAKSFLEIRNAALTFHVGEDKPWKRPELMDYDRFNHDQALEALVRLQKKYRLADQLAREHPQLLVGVDWKP